MARLCLCHCHCLCLCICLCICFCICLNSELNLVWRIWRQQVAVNDGPPWDSRTQALTSHQATEPAFLPTTTFCQAFLARIFPFRIPATEPIQRPNREVFFLLDIKILIFDTSLSIVESCFPCLAFTLDCKHHHHQSSPLCLWEIITLRGSPGSSTLEYHCRGKLFSLKDTIQSNGYP